MSKKGKVGFYHFGRSFAEAEVKINYLEKISSSFSIRLALTKPVT